MMADRRDYLHLNPFFSNAVPEEAFWRTDAEFPDVGNIHGHESLILEQGLDELAGGTSHATRVQFVVGGAGSGKSHLFGRLRRRLTRGEVFAFAANPPTRPSAIESWVLHRVISGMRRRIGKPYSQIQGFLYALVLSGGIEPGTDTDQLHAYWHGVSRASQRKFLRGLRSRLTSAGHWDPMLLPVLFDVLDPEKEDAALAWLAGATHLSDQDLELLQQGGPNERVLDTLLLLGQLARIASTPIVLVLDQLDQMQSRDQIAEFERLLIALHDAGRGWFIVVGLTREMLDVWRGQLSRPFIDRFLGQAQSMLELAPIRPELKRELLRLRLASHELQARRRADAIGDELFPLTERDVDEVAGSDSEFPRRVINHARERYRTCCAGDKEVAPPLPSLQEVAEQAFVDALAGIEPAEIVVDQAVLADRLAEVLEVVAAADGRAFARTIGPLESQRRFRGTDTVITAGAATLRLVGHHVQQGRQFPDFLKTVSALAPPVILVRDGAVPVSGPVTRRRLAEFRTTRTFLHLSRPHIAEAYALGKVLADMREGNFDDVQTEAKPARDEVVRTLGRIERLRQHPIVEAVRAALARTPVLPDQPGQLAWTPAQAAEVREAPPAGSQPPAPRGRAGSVIEREPVGPPDEQVTKAVASIMRRERWLVLDRLRRELDRRASLIVGARQLRRLIAREPLATSLTCHPEDIREEAEVHILIWAGE
ncbi:MAG: hypothetical protein AB1806_11640 [Acidobacteriota bacterium]